jgi:chemotaxis-related protein WspB
MLFLLVRIGADRYAIDAVNIIEVLPLVAIKRIPQAAAGIAGVFDYRGAAVPAIDLTLLALGREAKDVLSTRIVIVDHAAGTGRSRPLGLIAEGATETMRLAETDFIEFGVANGAAPYLGPVTRGTRGLIQRIEINRLLPRSVQNVLFLPVLAG